MPDLTDYSYRVVWSAEDAEYVATVAEFPSLSWLASTPVEALEGLVSVLRDVLGDPAAVGASAPGSLPETARREKAAEALAELSNEIGFVD